MERDLQIQIIVPEFLKLGLLEEWLESQKLNALEAFGSDTPALVAKIEEFHSSRRTLLSFQQFLESRVQPTE